MSDKRETKARYGMVIDLDRCTGCGACMVACAVENNVPSTPPEADDRKGLTWIRVYRVSREDAPAGEGLAFIPVSCQHCGEETPCGSVCPQKAVDVDSGTGIVEPDAQRVVSDAGTAWRPAPTTPVTSTGGTRPGRRGWRSRLNPDVSPRMRGVVEKCNFCHGRLAGRARRGPRCREGASSGPANTCRPASKPVRPGPSVFGDLNDPAERSLPGLLRSAGGLPSPGALGTEPKVYYRSPASLGAGNGQRPRPEERKGGGPMDRR